MAKISSKWIGLKYINYVILAMHSTNIKIITDSYNRGVYAYVGL